MPDDIDIGDIYRVSVPFTDADGTPQDPTTVKMFFRKPDATRVTYTYLTDAELVRDDVGKYHVDLTIDQSGTWTYRFEGASGPVTAADEETFDVKESRFY